MIVECKECKIEFDKLPSQIKRTKNNFCSQSCSAKFNGRGATKNKPKPRICQFCDETFYTVNGHRNRKTCTNCVGKFMSNFSTRPDLLSKAVRKLTVENLTLLELEQRLSNSDKHPSWVHSQVRTHNRHVNKHLKALPCSMCGYAKHVELAHIKAITSFPKSTTIGTINDSSNVLQLCRNCHWEFDNGLLTLSEIC